MFNLLKKLLILFVLIGSTGFSIYREHVTPPNATSDTNAEEYNRPSSIFAPTFTNCPADINNVSPNSGACTAVVTWTPPTATGSGTVTMTSNYNPGDAFYPGVHRVIYRATDSSGDTSFCEFRVEVLDNQAPVITVPANINTTADPGSCGAVITFPFPNATDNCPAGEGAPIDENFDGGNDLSSQCYDFDGTIVGSGGAINGSSGEVETVELIRNDIRSFTSPLTQFNGTGEIFFDHRILAGHPSGNLGTNSRLTVKLITAGGAETIIFTEQYVDEAVQTEYIEVTQSGNYFVQFEWETDQNRSDIAYLDNLYIPGYVVSDVTVVACTAAFLRVAQISGQPYRSGREFPVGTTTLEYITRDAAGNVGFNSFKVTVTNNITPPSGSDVEYCEGTTVPTLTVSVGSGQTVDWYDAAVGGTLLLSGNSSYQPSGPGDYFAETKETATGCVSATRRRIRLTENTQPSAPISPSPIEYCVNDPATPLMATGEPGNMILWYNAPTGGTMYPNPPTPDTSSAQTTFYYVEQIDAGTGCISERTEVVVTVYALPLAPIFNTPVEYCVGDTSDELNASVTNGSNLRWYDAASGGTEIPGTTRPDTSTPGQQFYWVTQSAVSGGANCESLRSQLTVNVNTSPAITMQPVDRSTCENGNAIFVVGASNADTFQWQLFDGSNWNDLTNTAPYSGATSNTLNISNVTLALNGNQYRALASSPAGSCPDAMSNSAMLTVNMAPPLPISGGDQTECEQNPIQTLTANANPPLGSTIVWYNAPSGGNTVANPILDVVGTITYYAESNDTSNSCSSAGRVPVTLTIQPVPAAPTSGGDQIECEENPIQTLTALATAASGATVVWYDAASGGNLIADPSLNSVGTVTYYAQSNNDVTGCPSAFRTAVSLSIQPAPAPPISDGDQTECETSPIQTLTANATVPTGFTITWFDAATGGNSVGSPTLNSVGSVTYFAESTNDVTSCQSITRTPVTLTIDATPSAPISDGDQTECETSPTQTMTATAVAPAGATVIWYDMPSGGAVVGSPTLNALGTITYYAESRTTTSGCFSDSRTPVTLTMNSIPSISITPASESCSADLASYSVSVDVDRGSVTASEGIVFDNGGNNWTVSEVPSGNDIVITVTDSNACVETLSIIAPDCSCPVVLAPTSGGDITECEQNPIQTLTATATAPAGASVVWYDSATNGTSVTNPILNTIGTITFYAESVDDVNACTSSTRTAVNLTIQAAPNAPISGGDQKECETIPTQTLTATATNAAGTSIIWYDAASNGNIVTNPILNALGTVTYYAETRNDATNCTSHLRTAVSLTIQPNPTAPISGGDQEQCESSPIQTLTAMATAPSGSTVVWYDAASGGNLISNPDLNTVGTITYYAESQDTTTNCASTSRTPVTLTIQDTPDISQTPSSATCSADLITYSVSVDVSTGSITASEGTVTDNGGNNWTVSNIPSGNDITVTVTAANACMETLTVTAPDCSCTVVDAPTSGNDQTECEASPIQTLTATATPPTDEIVVWFDAASGGNTVANPTLSVVGTVTYYAESRQNVTDCTSSTRTPVTLTIQSTPAAPNGAGDQAECEASPLQTLMADATAPSGSVVVWFDAASGGNIVASPTLSAVGTVTYYAESEDTTTACTSFTRTPITLTIQDTPDISIDGGPTCAPDLLTYGVTVNVSEGNVTSTEGTVVDNGGDNWTISGIPSGNDISLTVTAPNACTETLAITAPDCSCPIIDAPINDGDLTECEESPIQTLTATATPPTDADIVWYDAATGGNVVTAPTLNTVGAITYFAESRDIITNCTSSTRTPVQLTINGTPADPTSWGDQTECDANPTQTLTAMATSPSGTSIVWYDALSGGNVIANPILNAVGSVTYFAESRDDVSNCSSFGRAAVTLTINALPNVTANATQTNINAGEPVTLTGSGANSYVWDNGVGDGDTVFPLTTTTYTVVGTDANSCENSDSITVIVGSTSDIRLEKTVNDPTPNVGDNIVFTLTVTNDGPSDDSGGSIVNDILPVGYTYVADTGNTANGTFDSTSGNWTLPALTNGNSASITITTTVNPPAGISGEYTNSAQVVSAGNFDSDSAPNNDDGDQSEDDEASVSIIPQVADLEVNNTISQPTGNPGEALIISVDITNNGPSDATNLCVENSVPDGFMVNTIQNGGIQTGNNIVWTGIDIATGSTTTVTFEVSVNNPNNSPDEYVNTVQIISVDQFDLDSTPNNDDGDQSEDDEDSVLFMLQFIDLELTNTVTPDSGNPGDTLTFTVDVRNTGMDDATNVTIENIVPSGYTVSAINDGGLQSGNTIAWNGLTVPSGSTTRLTFEVSINVPTNTTGEFVNTVQVTDADQLDSDSSPNNDDGDQSEDDEDSAEIVLIPADLSLEKALTSASNQNPNAGDTIIFQLILTNAGPGLATNVTVEDIVPSGYTVGTIGNGGSMNGNTIVWNLPSIDEGSEVLTYEATVNLPANIFGEYTNTAQITTSDQFDPDSTPNNDVGNQIEDDEANYTIGSPTVDIEINKMVDKAQSFYGDTLVFTVTATNNSNYDATTIGIEDVLPRGYALVSHSADLGTYNETIATWEIPTITVGQTAALQMTVNVTETEDYTNIAELIYLDQIDTNINNDRAEATPEVTQAECLTVFNEFSPNDDGANDFFFIECIENYPNSLLRIYNRWGNEVFSAEGYDNSWDGTSVKGSTIGASGKLPVGTYYYTLEPGEGNATAKSGWLYISR
ncbi:MAG TPA: DUF11 domain-containing protein [Pricia antarctica]|uniref:DUF11 domain-containing protein n=1 Tax=Pricia antarctica TaxID=641691 RepID=A0A831VQY7_9FLAO|nr:DUF11 domain-containing protein [Pricia antarctica]